MVIARENAQLGRCETVSRIESTIGFVFSIRSLDNTGSTNGQRGSLSPSITKGGSSLRYTQPDSHFARCSRSVVPWWDGMDRLNPTKPGSNPSTPYISAWCPAPLISRGTVVRRFLYQCHSQTRSGLPRSTTAWIRSHEYAVCESNLHADMRHSPSHGTGWLHRTGSRRSR